MAVKVSAEIREMADWYGGSVSAALYEYAYLLEKFEFIDEADPHSSRPAVLRALAHESLRRARERDHHRDAEIRRNGTHR